MNRLILLTCALLAIGSAIHVSVKNSVTNTYCVILEGDVSGSVQYINKEGKSDTYNFVVNTTDNVSGVCNQYNKALNESTDVLKFHFLPNNVAPQPPIQDALWSLRLVFASPKSSSSSFKLADYELKAVFNESLVANETTVYYNRTDGASLEWTAVDTHGFTCSKSSLALTNSSNIDFSNLRVIAFAMLESDQFPKTQLFEQCKLDVRTSDLVPIIVGVCLAGLVIVVLIAYLIGRARARRTGYASV
jgi:hypothetical protein